MKGDLPPSRGRRYVVGYDVKGDLHPSMGEEIRGGLFSPSEGEEIYRIGTLLYRWEGDTWNLGPFLKV